MYVYINTCIYECVTHLQYILHASTFFSISSPKFCAICVTTPPLPSSHTPRGFSLSLCLSLWIELNPVSVCRILLFFPFLDWSRQFVLYTYTHTNTAATTHTYTLYMLYIYVYLYFFYNFICVILNLIYLICNPCALSCVSMYKQNKKKRKRKNKYFYNFLMLWDFVGSRTL